jgi:hypothetical protein
VLGGVLMEYFRIRSGEVTEGLLLFVLLIKLWNDQIKNSEIGTACNTHGNWQKYVQNFGRELAGNRYS